MKTIENERFDEERALYGQKGLFVENCVFDGPADGESALKECSDVLVRGCQFELRYPFWHNRNLTISDSKMSESCRSALWYTDRVDLSDSALHGIKALRECSNVRMERCDIHSAEFGWSVRGIEMTDTSAISEYFMMRSDHLVFKNVRLNGKYSFQYIHDAVFDQCEFDTKDAFWHAKDVIVRNSVIKGEYLAWYSENLTLENCTIIGTQPFVSCRNLRLINCEMVDTDLAFERSDVRATLNAPIESIKNPLSGTIVVPCASQIIYDIDEAKGIVIETDKHPFSL